nr:hypothetical protein Iba_chr07aCG0840 [Ipomoea batatas]
MRRIRVRKQKKVVEDAESSTDSPMYILRTLIFQLSSQRKDLAKKPRKMGAKLLLRRGLLRLRLLQKCEC